MSLAEEMTLETFKLWNTNALKSFLSARKKSVDGTFDELASRAFVAWEDGVLEDMDAENKEHCLVKEYREKLVLDGAVAPDPFSIKSGWVGETAQGLSKWPSLYFYDIAEYLKSKSSGDLMNRLVNEYKEGKAYRYYSCGWVKEIFIHPISPVSKYCVLKTRVTPSQRLSLKPYDVWAIIQKDCQDHPGGAIMSCYCSCTAGLHDSCNHVAGLLFRIEAAVIKGVTKPTCTSQLSEWVKPATKSAPMCQPISNLVFKKDHYRKLATSDPEKMTTNQRKRTEFLPMDQHQVNLLADGDAVRQSLHSILKVNAPGSCFQEFMEAKKLSAKDVPDAPVSLLKQAESFFTSSSSVITTDAVKDFTKNHAKLTSQEQDAIYQLTVGQAENSQWFDQRKGRITASVMHRVYTRSQTLQRSPESDHIPLVSSLMGYKKMPETAALKHGRSMEPHAKTKYLQISKKAHKKLKSQEPGLLVCPEHPYIAASADLDITCMCCGAGHVEIKCPYSIMHTSPTAENLSYLERDGDKIVLKKNTSYYFQVQGQMAVSKRAYTDFFVFTLHGYILIRIHFDKSHWEMVSPKLVWFWEHNLGKEVLTRNIASQLAATTFQEDNNKENNATVAAVINMPKAIPSSRKTAVSSRSGVKRKKKVKNPVILCGQCGDQLNEEPQVYEDESIGCDSCPLWFHKVCVNIKDNEMLPKKWHCKKCSTVV